MADEVRVTYVGDCRRCKAIVVDCCDQCERCVDCCLCFALTAEERDLVVGAIPLQALPNRDVDASLAARREGE